MAAGMPDCFQRFAQFFCELDTRHPEVFQWNPEAGDAAWITTLPNIEERIFAHFIQGVAAPKKDASKNYWRLGSWQKIIEEYGRNALANYVLERLPRITVGGYAGAHRKAPHRMLLPPLLTNYLSIIQKVSPNLSQHEFYAKTNFNSAFELLDALPSIGPLTAFDILERLYRARLVSDGPSMLPVTGGGIVDGLHMLADDKSVPEEETARELCEVVLRACPKRNVALTLFDLETVVCCYRKANLRSSAETFLRGHLDAKQFASKYWRWWCEQDT